MTSFQWDLNWNPSELQARDLPLEPPRLPQSWQVLGGIWSWVFQNNDPFSTPWSTKPSPIMTCPKRDSNSSPSELRALALPLEPHNPTFTNHDKSSTKNRLGFFSHFHLWTLFFIVYLLFFGALTLVRNVQFWWQALVRTSAHLFKQAPLQIKVL